MTTDNRTNEPTEAQVEAALDAHAAHKGAWVDEFKEMVCPECGWCYMTADERRPDNKPSNEVVLARVDAHRMRAALVAASGAGPQAESVPLREALKTAREHFTAIAGSGEIRVWEDTGEKLGIDHQVSVWAKRGERICRDALAAPVQPSSTVDEAALAEEIGRHKLVHVSASRKSAFCMCSTKVTAGVEDNLAWFEGHRARAVAEWFMGQER